MTLRESKQAIRSFIRQHWSDQKLAEVYAFNADGKMKYDHYCECIRGVTLADTLHCHGSGCDTGHYGATVGMSDVVAVEKAYFFFGVPTGFDPAYAPFRFAVSPESDQLRQRRLSPILKAEMRRRARVGNQLSDQHLDQDAAKEDPKQERLICS